MLSVLSVRKIKTFFMSLDFWDEQNQGTSQQKPKQAWQDKVETSEWTLSRILLEIQQVKQNKGLKVRCQEIKVVVIIPVGDITCCC